MQQVVSTSAPQIQEPTRPRASPPGRGVRNTRDETCSDRGHPSASSGQALGEQRRRIETVRANNPIEQVIGRFIELRHSGRRLVGRCPFHEERSPSLVVYPHNQSWYCFGCDAGGDVFKFIQLIEKVPFAEALQRLGSNTLTTHRDRQTPTAQANTLTQTWADRGEQLTLTEEHFTLLTAATEVYHAAIFTQPRVLEYLAKRRIDLDIIRRHHIGFATGNDLAKYFRFRGWDPEIANDLGLIGPRGEYFRQRIVIPELRGGRAIYLVGRATQKYQKAKYLGLPGAPKPLYGLVSIQGKHDVYIVEGVMDWLTLVQWGYPSVALLGSHLKHDQIREIADAERIFIVTDSDEPGRKSARQLTETLGKRARIVPPLPNAKDVNALAMQPNGQEVFVRLVAQARAGVL